MEIIVQNRNTGKTTQLIQMAAKHWYYIICINSSHADSISMQAQSMGLKIPYPITYYAFDENRYHRDGIKGFLFDDLDLYIQSKSQVSIKAVTLSNDSGFPAFTRRDYQEAKEYLIKTGNWDKIKNSSDSDGFSIITFANQIYEKHKL